VTVKVLDCTLRDGGYYCHWDFDVETVHKYLSAMSAARVDILEIGFRFLPQDNYLGPFAYSTDGYISKLPLPESVAIAVMVNAGDLLAHQHGSVAAVKQLFVPADQSPVDMVRVATHVQELQQCGELILCLKNMGYKIAVNLMQVGNLSVDSIVELALLVFEWDVVDVLYFADSLGNMDPIETGTMVKALKSVWGGSLGIHTHDNKGQALLNTIAAIEAGVEYVDCTVLGMGRGAGNARTENLLVELSRRDYNGYYPDAVFPLVLHEFKALQSEFCWGPNLYYYLSATYGIHPTYVQEMLGDDRYSTEHILGAVNFLRSSSATSYNFETLLRAIAGKDGDENGAWDATGWLAGKDVLIIGQGPSIKRHRDALLQFIESSDHAVFCLNVNDIIPSSYVTAYVACHETRLLIEAHRYNNLGKPLIIPLSRLPDELHGAMNGVDVLDYGLRLKEGVIEGYANGCVLSSSLVLMYSLMVATASGANRVILAGMDGYDSSDPRQLEMVRMLEGYYAMDSHLPVMAITPSTYPVEQRSLYDPRI
jgi:4-hydroxy 2-oxovalerate aldolase